MKVSYFPGCTLKNKAKELDAYARSSAAYLGVELEEIENWQCCGGAYTTAKNEAATKLSSVRALKAASEKNQPLITVCSACHNVIKQTNYEIQSNKAFCEKVNQYMAEEREYHGEAEVYHYLEMLRDIIGFDKVKASVVNSLRGKKIAAYYGCLLLRPSKVMRMDDPENPTIIEELIRALGAEAIVYSRRNECCGAYASLESPDTARRNASAIIQNAKAAGAEMIITACPLCKYNLEKYSSELPVIYFTEILAEALGVKEDTSNSDGK